MEIVQPASLVVLVLEIEGVEPAYNFKIIEDYRQQYPNAKIMAVISEYDDDPRELWEIDEVRQHLQELLVIGDSAGLKHWQVDHLTSVLHEQTFALFCACIFGPGEVNVG